MRSIFHTRSVFHAVGISHSALGAEYLVARCRISGIGHGAEDENRTRMVAHMLLRHARLPVPPPPQNGRFKMRLSVLSFLVRPMGLEPI